MSAKQIFAPLEKAGINLSNRIVMSPLTRSRAVGNVPNALMAEYYAQRAGAGLIITEGTSPSRNGLGYARMPGIYSKEQVAGWKLVTDAVHARGGKIFVQIMHTGRITHPLNLPEGGRVFAPSAVVAPGKMWTDQQGTLPYPIPQEFSLDGIAEAKAEFVQAARNAVEAGFDGIELHGANGYLLEQFLSPHTNKRNDQYGGSVENRARFVLEVAKEASEAIGKEKVGIRFSPYGVASYMEAYPEIDETYTYLAKELNKLGILYIHVADHSASGAPEVPVGIKHAIRREFKNVLIMAGGYDLAKAETDLTTDFTDLVAFGKNFINNPDLVNRFRQGRPLNLILDASTFYTSGAKGYIDYPVFEEATLTV
jgi:N-ethylmaleimide reductase